MALCAQFAKNPPEILQQYGARNLASHHQDLAALPVTVLLEALFQGIEPLLDSICSPAGMLICRQTKLQFPAELVKLNLAWLTLRADDGILEDDHVLLLLNSISHSSAEAGAATIMQQ